jgi:hypothetical protein
VKQSIGPLGEIDVLTDKELRESLGHHFSAEIKEWYRGVDFLSFAGPANGASSVQIPGPDQGYTWSVKLLSVIGNSSSADTVAVALKDTGTSSIVGVSVPTITAQNFPSVFMWSSNQLVIKDGRAITVTGLFGHTTFDSYLLMVEQVPTVMQGKL